MMAQFHVYIMMSETLSSCAQLGDTFLSCKHLDYLASIAEFISEVRV